MINDAEHAAVKKRKQTKNAAVKEKTKRQLKKTEQIKMGQENFPAPFCYVVFSVWTFIFLPASDEGSVLFFSCRPLSWKLWIPASAFC